MYVVKVIRHKRNLIDTLHIIYSERWVSLSAVTHTKKNVWESLCVGVSGKVLSAAVSQRHTSIRKVQF